MTEGRPTGVASTDGPQVRTGGTDAWQIGQRVRCGYYNYEILGISDNGLYLGYRHAGVSDIKVYTRFTEIFTARQP